MPKAPDSDSPDPSDLAFEDALAQLEDLIRGMESDEMPLEQLITNYEQGTRLFQVCEKRLNEAEGRIESIRKKRNGERVVEPFGEEVPPEEESPGEDVSEATDESDDHGELF